MYLAQGTLVILGFSTVLYDLILFSRAFLPILVIMRGWRPNLVKLHTIPYDTTPYYIILYYTTLHYSMMHVKTTRSHMDVSELIAVMCCEKGGGGHLEILYYTKC